MGSGFGKLATLVGALIALYGLDKLRRNNIFKSLLAVLLSRLLDNAPFLDSSEGVWQERHLTPKRVGDCIGFKVKALQVRPIGQGTEDDSTGLMSAMFRVGLTYEDGAGSAQQTRSKGLPLPPPASLIVKLSPPFFGVRLIGTIFGLFNAEVRFYADGIGGTVGVKTPNCYHAALEGHTHRCCIIAEDMAPRRPPDQFGAMTETMACEAVTELALLHSHYHNQIRAKMPSTDWVLTMDSDRLMPIAMGQYYKQVDFFLAFAAKIGKPVTVKTRALAEVLRVRGPSFHKLAELSPRELGGPTATTLTHGDFRPENIFFGDGQPVTMIDFQLAKESPGEFDLTWMVTQGWPVDTRRQREMAVIEAYYTRMCELVPPTGPGQTNGQAAGAASGGMDALELVCVQYSAQAAIILFQMGLTAKDAAAAIQSQEKNLKLITALYERLWAFIEDWNTLPIMSALLDNVDDAVRDQAVGG